MGDKKLFAKHDRQEDELHVEQLGYVGTHVSQVRVADLAKYPKSQVWLQVKSGFK